MKTQEEDLLRNSSNNFLCRSSSFLLLRCSSSSFRFLEGSWNNNSSSWVRLKWVSFDLGFPLISNTILQLDT
ncbi:hypothetical protein C5167_046118 [Papaver somniferum]|uniref:Uncharacterized protein n=1 Tax=Papaver somniferum TaxID=3469 RepID=A0A4Y7LGI2_PAPSO|nr:hypothetical protein C5167_046118 [Papaver somniferum]